MTNSRRKGKAGEREAAEILRAWWDPVEPGVKFASAPLSGGWHSAQMRGALRLCGDLVTSSHTFPFIVEVKRREKVDVSRLYLPQDDKRRYRSPVYGWWEQACAAASEARANDATREVYPLLMFRQSRKPWYCVVSPEMCTQFAWEQVLLHPDTEGFVMPLAKFQARQARSLAAGGVNFGSLGEGAEVNWASARKV